MDTIELTNKACNSLSERLNEDIVPEIVKNPINNLVAGFKNKKILRIFRIPIFIIDQDVSSGKYIIHSLRKKYDEVINNFASEFNLEYSKIHEFRGALII